MIPGISCGRHERLVSLAPLNMPHLGGCIFAEDPTLVAPDARIVWADTVDPAILTVRVEPAGSPDPDSLDPSTLARWLTVVKSSDGREHAVLSDGYRRIRLDIEAGSLLTTEPVLLSYRIQGLLGAERRVLPLRRFLHLCRHHRFSATLFPPEAGLRRAIDLLRVYDAFSAGAGQREIGEVLFGRERVREQWNGASDAMRSRVKRLMRDARGLAQGGWRTLLRRR